MNGDNGDSMEPAPDAVEVVFSTDREHVWGDNSMVTEEIEETNNATDPAHLREDAIFNAVQVKCVWLIPHCHILFWNTLRSSQFAGNTNKNWKLGLLDWLWVFSFFLSSIHILSGFICFIWWWFWFQSICFLCKRAWSHLFVWNISTND